MIDAFIMFSGSADLIKDVLSAKIYFKINVLINAIYVLNKIK